MLMFSFALPLVQLLLMAFNPDFHFGFPESFECTPQALRLRPLFSQSIAPNCTDTNLIFGAPFFCFGSRGHGSKFGRKKEEAIAALLTQRNLDEAARAIGVAPNTLLKWQKLPEFQTAYRESRRAAYGQAVARLQQGTSAAATTLLKTMIDPNTPASVRVRAAEAIFNHAAKAIEIEDIEARVAALEAVAPGEQRR